MTEFMLDDFDQFFFPVFLKDQLIEIQIMAI
jgi:hypothetical protein